MDGRQGDFEKKNPKKLSQINWICCVIWLDSSFPLIPHKSTCLGMASGGVSSADPKQSERSGVAPRWGWGWERVQVFVCKCTFLSFSCLCFPTRCVCVSVPRKSFPSLLPHHPFWKTKKEEWKMNYAKMNYVQWCEQWTEKCNFGKFGAPAGKGGDVQQGVSGWRIRISWSVRRQIVWSS